MSFSPSLLPRRRSESRLPKPGFWQRGWRALAIALSLAAPLVVPGVARATIVERVVAVVGDRAILLSELVGRARPFQMQVYGSVPEGASRNAALSQLYKQIV